MKLRAAIGSFPDYLDPQLAYSIRGWTAMYNTYVPLLTYEHASGQAGSEVVAGLAEDLPRVTDGGKTYTLILRPGLEYSNGSPVRASDFEFALTRMFKLRSGGSHLYMNIAGAARFKRTKRGGIGGIATNDKTGKVVIHLVDPDGSFPQRLALPFAAPVPRGTPIKSRTWSPPPATGPYRIVDPDLDGWTYARNPAWERVNGSSMPHLPGGFADEIEVRVIRGGNAEIEAVMRGELDLSLDPLPARHAELRRSYGPARFRTQPFLGTYYFWMNSERPPFDDVRVRRAVDYAVDPVALTRAFNGSNGSFQLTPTHQILPPGVRGYERFDPYPHDMVRARKLIAKADPRDREITLWTAKGLGERRMATYYRSQLRKLGFTVRLRAAGFLDYFFQIARTSTPGLDTGIANWYADCPHPDEYFTPLLSGSSSRARYTNNLSRLDVPRLNARIAGLAKAPLGPGVESRYAALERNVMRQAPWVPIGNPVGAVLASKRVDLDQMAWGPVMGPDLAGVRVE